MSGGSLNYLAFKMNDELFDKAAVHYSNVDNPKEATYARRDDPIEDRDISELVFDVACVVHALEWYKSGDICEETYREVLAKFKKNYSLDEAINIRVYKKALKLLCEYLDDSGICVGCGKNCPPDGSKTSCSNIIYETYLHEAREEE